MKKNPNPLITQDKRTGCDLQIQIWTEIERRLKVSVSSVEEVCNGWSCVPKKNHDMLTSI
jgi:hypothetical protein